MYYTIGILFSVLLFTPSSSFPEDGAIILSNFMKKVGLALIQRETIKDGQNYPLTDYCSCSIIGKHLILTNNHCIATSEDCRNASFKFPNWTNKASSVIELACDSLVYTNKSHDYSIVETHIDLSSHLGALTLPQDKVHYRKDTAVWILSRNPQFEGKITRCNIGSSEKLTLPNCSLEKGASGSPVLNYHGNLIGIIYANSEKDSLFTPISHIIAENSDLFFKKE